MKLKFKNKPEKTDDRSNIPSSTNSMSSAVSDNTQVDSFAWNKTIQEIQKQIQKNQQLH